MTDIVQIAVVTVIGGGFVAIAGKLVTKFVDRWFRQMDAKLDAYHKEVDGKMTKLLIATKAEGKLEAITEIDTISNAVVETIKKDPEVEVKKNGN